MRIVTLALIALLGLAAVVPVAAQTNPTTVKAAPSSQGCAAAAMQDLAASTGQRLTAQEAATVSRWCSQWDVRDAAALAGKQMAAGDRAPRTTPIVVDKIGTVPPEPAIWCTKTWCVCYEGKKWNGCVHAEKLCSNGGLTCGPGGKVCGCKAG